MLIVRAGACRYLPTYISTSTSTSIFISISVYMYVLRMLTSLYEIIVYFSKRGLN